MFSGRSSAGTLGAIAAALFLIAALGIGFLGTPTYSIIAFWMLAGIVIGGGLLWAGAKLDPEGQRLSNVAQGVAGLVTIVALFIAAGFYFLERKDKPSIVFNVDAARAFIGEPGVGGRPGGPGHVLLGIRLLVTNNGARRVTLKCIALSVFHPLRPGRFVRSGANEDMQLAPLTEHIAYDVPNGRPPHDFDVDQINHCLDQDLARARARRSPTTTRAQVRPLFMWSPLTLEPNDVDDRYFEIDVDCREPFVRVLVKMRIEPDDANGYETKAIIPLAEICLGHASGMAAPVVPPGPLGPAPAAPGPL
jgi:hypothetical protein